eukprot:5844045-Amphidinium_carterae.1
MFINYRHPEFSTVPESAACNNFHRLGSLPTAAAQHGLEQGRIQDLEKGVLSALYHGLRIS